LLLTLKGISIADDIIKAVNFHINLNIPNIKTFQREIANVILSLSKESIKVCLVGVTCFESLLNYVYCFE
jgi:hypothetical protein